MSWLARSIANTLNLDNSDDEDKERGFNAKSDPRNDFGSPKSPSSSSSPRGVKEDLSEITKTISRQFWGVASFLAPPPEHNRSESSDPGQETNPITGIRGDIAEIGGKFRSGISKLSNNINVSEITKMASSLLNLEPDDEGEIGARGVEVVGVTEEVVGFVRDIALHPETWLDFPILDSDGDDDDFDMSDAQQEHALAVERLVPRLTDLRIELCPEYISESWFWKIYFVLLHPRLDKEDAAVLSTPQIMEARALLANELKNRRTKTDEHVADQKSSDSDENPKSHVEEALSVPSPVKSQAEFKKASDDELREIATPTTSETVNRSLESKEIQIKDKTVIEDQKNATTPQVKEQYFKPSPSNFSRDKDEDDENDDADDWLKEEETSEIGGGNNIKVTIPILNDEDVSFSDLEEEDDDGDDATNNYRKMNYSSDKDSRDWVQLGKNSSSDSSSKDTNAHDGKESNDWLDVDDDIAVS